MIPKHSAHNSLVALLRWRAEHQPEQRGYTFLSDGETVELELTYAQLDRRARMIAALLQQSAATGARALLLYPPGPDYVAAFFGCLYAGVVAIPAYPPRPGQIHRSLARLQAIAEDARPQIALTTTSILSAVESLSADDSRFGSMRWLATDLPDDQLAGGWVPPTIGEDTIALLQYTSGSTATPKGVVLRHGNLLHNSAHIQRCFGHTAESSGVIWLPPYHDMGLIGGIIQPLYAGFPVVLMPPVAFLQRPARWLEAVSRYGATTSGGPNFAYDLCVRKIPVEQRGTLDLSRWQVAFTGAEPVRAETLERFTEAFGPCGFQREAFYPCYGLAEATLIVSGGATDELPVVQAFDSEALRESRAVAAAANRQSQQLVGCGRPLPDQQIVIAQPETLATCAPGEIGEIWIAGASVAAGYWDRPDATAQTFGAYLADTGGGPFLRTGDLGFLRGGELFITGRSKDLIILRGRNHYPQDIELTVERSHPALRPGSGAAFTVQIADEERLIVVQEVERQHRMSIAIDAVAGAIRQAVAAEHEAQVYAVVLIRPGSIPKTSSGKIQRQLCRTRWLAQDLDVIGDSVLRATHADAISERLTAEALRGLDPVERRRELESYLLAQIASAVGIAPPALDPQRSISALGIDSLAAVELQYQIETDLEIAVPMVTFLKDRSIAALTAEIERLVAAPAARLNVAPAHASGEPFPLSYGQRALWFLHQLAPESASYNIVAAVQCGPDLDSVALERALQRLVDRHPALRTTFGSVGGEPFQRVHNHMSIELAQVDARDWSEAALHRELAAAAYAPFDLARDSLLRVCLYERPDQTRILLLAIHHIITDFWSLGVFTRELDLLYKAEQSGQPVALPPLSASYANYVHWQAHLLAGAEGERLWQYWQKQLAGATPVLDLPTDYPRPPAQTDHGTTHTFALGAELSGKIKALAQSAGATLYTTLLAAFQVLLYRYTGQHDLIVGSPGAGRSSADVSNLIGYFVNPVALRARLAGNPAFLDVLAQARETVLAALEHQDYPFPLLVERLDLERLPDRSPLVQVMFLLQKASSLSDASLTKLALGVPGASLTIGGVPVEIFPLEQRVARFDLTLTMADIGDELVGALEYNTDLFHPTTIERMAEHFQVLLDQIVTQPEQGVANLRLLTEAERDQILNLGRAPATASEPVCLHQLLADQAARSPDATTVVFEDRSLAYAELDQRANQLAHHLRALGVGPEVRVGICLHRSLDLLVGLLGILKAGGAYVPLDPSYPAERLRFMLTDSAIRVLVTQEALLAQIPPISAQMVCLDRDWATIADQPATPPETLVTPANLAYVLYTSGSTGQPKGVMISHNALVNFLHSMRREPGIQAGDTLLAVTTIAFDIAGLELFLPLLAGAKLVLADRETASDGKRLSALLHTSGATIMQATPATWRLLLAAGWVGTPGLRALCGGEALPWDLAQLLLERVAELWNLYGPTETTIWSAAMQVRREDGRTSLGRPVANTQLYVLDAQMNPVPLCVPGELHIGGHGLARGYLNGPDLTAARFVPDPFAPDPGALLYKTGDVARYRFDGSLEFLGRIDHQVKLRGYRIELGEIENVLRQHEAVRDAVVIVREDRPGDRRLVAYVVQNAEHRTESKDAELDDSWFRVLSGCLGSQLPDHMIPSAFVPLDALPLTPNGKVDRKALPAPDRALSATAFVAPRTPAEEIIAEILADVLGRDSIGIHDSFFALGGHSLLAVQALSRLNDTFQIDMPLQALFNTPTIAGLSAVVEDYVLQQIEGLTDDEVLALTQSQPRGEHDRL